TETMQSAAYYGDPLFLNLAVDLDLPVIETDFLSIVGFADLAGFLPYFRTANSTLGIAEGFAMGVLWNDMSPDAIPFRNYGIAAGLFGNVLMLDWRLAYRDYNGIFRPSFYNSSYERKRGEHVRELASYMSNRNAAQYNTRTVGIYGEGGFSFTDLFSVELSYMWPWTPGAAPEENLDTPDFFSMSAVLEPGLIPVIEVHGSISYERTGFVQTLADDSQETSLFDANTVLSGEIIYPIAPTLDIAIMAATNVVRNEAGNIVYDENGNPTIAPAISIETQVHF
ncbi:MAG: hypothetical protein ACLFR1_12950, partial [Spirochaetia bacterium]